MPVASSFDGRRYGACGVYHRTLEFLDVLGVVLTAWNGHDDSALDGFLGGVTGCHVRAEAHGGGDNGGSGFGGVFGGGI